MCYEFPFHKLFGKHECIYSFSILFKVLRPLILAKVWEEEGILQIRKWVNLGIFRWERGFINHSELKELETFGKVPRPPRLGRKLTKGLNVALLLIRSQLSFKRLSLQRSLNWELGFPPSCFVLKIHNDIRHLWHMLHILEEGDDSSSIVFFFLRMPRRNMN